MPTYSTEFKDNIVRSKRGIATPKEDMDIINARLKIAEAYIKVLRK